jgi:thiol:disulfide interchange protein DsbD
VSCKELELRTLADQRVKERLTRYERIEVDLSILGVDQKDLLKNYGLFGPPAIIILDDRGIEKNLRVAWVLFRQNDCAICFK